MKRLAVVLAAYMVAGLGHAEPAAERLPAFAGAEGYGAFTPGGRGGKVLFVTNLGDCDPGKDKAIPGSLRAAIEAKGPRIVVFRVAGTIALKAKLAVREPYLTLAGQSAPGNGVCVKDHMAHVVTHDVIVRHLRFRPGDEMKKSLDALWLTNAENVIVDHCSTSWGNDEVLSVTRDSKNVTVQWCIIAEALHNSHHEKGRHGFGSIIAGYDGGITFHHNLYAHNSSRNPRPGGYPDKPGPIVDLRNNVIYNWGHAAGYNGENRVRINYVGNYLKPGPSTTRPKHAFSIGGPATRMHAAGNFLIGHDDANKDNWQMIRIRDEANKVAKPFGTPAVTTHSHKQAYKLVLAGAGATRPERDAADARLVREVTKGKGKLIDSPKDVGGWPVLRSLVDPPADTDADGMPDDWETRHGLNPKDPADGNKDADGDGYTNIEEWLNSTGPDASETLLGAYGERQKAIRADLDRRWPFLSELDKNGLASRSWIAVSLSGVGNYEPRIAGSDMRLNRFNTRGTDRPLSCGDRMHGAPQLSTGVNLALALRSSVCKTDDEGRPLPRTVDLPIDEKVRAVYVLHGATHATRPGVLGTFELVYEDGSTHVVENFSPGAAIRGNKALGSKATVQDWSLPKLKVDNEHSRPVCVRLERADKILENYLYQQQIVNPHPDRLVKALRVTSEGTQPGSIVVFSVTALASSNTLKVDFSKPLRPAEHRACGFLHGIRETSPDDSLLEPLKIRYLRGAPFCYLGSLLETGTLERVRKLGARLSLGVYYRGIKPKTAGREDYWAAWEQAVEKEVGEAVSRGVDCDWVVANEPDRHRTDPTDRYMEWHRRGYLKIKSLLPKAHVSGPTIARFDYAYLTSFLRRCKREGCVPELVSWHDGWGPSKVQTHIETVRRWCRKNDLRVNGIVIDEYSARRNWPGLIVAYLSALEKGKVTYAAMSVWSGTGRLCGATTKDGKKPLCFWWVFKGYSDIEGTLYDVRETLALSAVAGFDEKAGRISVLVGNTPSVPRPVKLRLTNLHRIGILPGSKVAVERKLIPDAGQEPLEALKPLPVLKHEVAANAQATIDLGALDGRAAMEVIIRSAPAE